MRHNLTAGDLVRIDPGYSSGIWLRQAPTEKISTDSNHVMNCVMIVLQFCIDDLSSDASVKILSSCGKAGWTFASRLRKIL